MIEENIYLYMDMVDLMVLLMVVDLVDMVLVEFEFLFDQTLVQKVYDVLVVIKHLNQLMYIQLDVQV